MVATIITVPDVSPNHHMIDLIGTTADCLTGRCHLCFSVRRRPQNEVVCTKIRHDHLARQIAAQLRRGALLSFEQRRCYSLE
jgi:hypothetical protein